MGYNSSTRDQTQAPCTGSTREVPTDVSLVLTASEWYGDDGSEKHCGLRYYILYVFENLESWNTKAVKDHKELWILRHTLKFLHVLWDNSAKDYFSLHFNEFSLLLFFFFLPFVFSGSSDSGTWNFHFHETKAWGGKQEVSPHSEACVYHGREVSTDPWTQTKQSIYSW